MALTPLRLALFLLLICVSATVVTSQEVTVTKVTTTSVVLNWQKEGMWEDVVTYQVNITANGHAFCEKTHYCFVDGTCSFHTGKKCAMFPACADVVATISGGGYTAPSVSVQSAPAAVTDVKVTGSMELKKIIWTNPTSSCFVETVVNVNYGGYYDYTMILNPAATSLSVPLCNKGSGLVTVQASGGDGASDPAFAVIKRLTGDDTVTLTSCPPEGCTDMTVEWEYSPVCSEVTHFEVTATLESYTFNTTTNLTTTNATFEDLELDTLYKTCVSALDLDENLMAASCTTCGGYPEVADQLTVVNVTESTAELEWKAPICQVDDDIEYKVFYSLNGKEISAYTNKTTFLWTELSPAVYYTFCVLVQHPNVVPIHTATCISSYTLPEAPEKIDVRIYEITSLFITWPADLFTPNLKYLVSWGDNLEQSNFTEYKSYTIDGYNQTVGPNKVCVQTVIKTLSDIRSDQTCQEQPFAAFGDPKPDNTAMTVSVLVSAGLAVLLSVVLVVMAKHQERHVKSNT